MSRAVRFGQNALDGPSALQSRSQASAIDTDHGRPFCKGECLVVKRQANGISSIVRLLCARRPSTVGRFVVAGIVDSIDRVRLRRTRAHVGKKGAEIVLPSVTDANAFLAVFPVVTIVRIAATVFYALPRRVFDALTAAVRQSPLSDLLIAPAATTAATAFTQGVTNHVSFDSAIAAAHPNSFAFFVRRECRTSDDGPACEALS